MIVEGRNATIHTDQQSLIYKNKVDVRSYTFSIEDLTACHNEVPFDRGVGFLTLAISDRDFELNYIESQAPEVAELVRYINMKRPDLAKGQKVNWLMGLLDRRRTPRRAK